MCPKCYEGGVGPLCDMHNNVLTLSVKVSIVFPARRCCYCGDKIKDDLTGPMLALTWSDGAVTYLEGACVRGFVGDEEPFAVGVRQYPEAKAMLESSLK